MVEKPLSNGNNGDPKPDQDLRGRFAKGNKAAVGRRKMHAAHVQRLRTAMFASFSVESVQRVVAELEILAEQGNIQAIKEYLDRAVGKPLPLDVVERLQQIEEALGIEVPVTDD